MAVQYRFRRNSKIGYITAEEDLPYLTQCFIDKGDLESLANELDPRSIVLGRTGTGKSALLLQLSNRSNVRLLSPEDFSLQFLSDSRLLANLRTLGVNFDLFYRYLWRHLFVIEFIKMRYNIKDENESRNVFERFVERVKSNAVKQRAINYLRDWGSKFWVDTYSSAKQVTERFESSLTSALGAKASMVSGKLEAVDHLSSEQKQDVQQLGQEIVNRWQLAELSKVLDFLNDEVFSDPQHTAIICVDKLDENWSSSDIKSELLRGLIGTRQTNPSLDEGN